MDYSSCRAKLPYDYAQKLTKSTLAVKLSVSAIIYPRWTATIVNSPQFEPFEPFSLKTPSVAILMTGPSEMVSALMLL